MSFSVGASSGAFSCSSVPITEIEERNTATLKSLSMGDLVKFNRSWYFHWAVYIGDDLVIHLVSDAKSTESCTCGLERRGAVEEEVQSVDNNCCTKCGKPFKSCAQVMIQNFWNVVDNSIATKDNPYDGKWAAFNPDDIVKRAREKLGPSNYHVLKMNCEHFAMYCRYDKPWSSQTLMLWHTARDFVLALKGTLTN